ncbi:tetratricopeptide repeat protein [Gayadomonas joobiniege]|uniref:tetratricopeptide repeat protein n=1 Tax=Gayadomonas joobiniege TaxID=1234606 RepID=UPI0003785BC2|nr:tetratricopeptide repeat protein [Gayadomonas joobiniege]
MKLSRLILSAVLVGFTATATITPVVVNAQTLAEKKKARPVEVMSENVGKKVGEAIGMLTGGEDGEEKASTAEVIRILEEIEPKKEFDKAFLAQLIGKLYAQEGDYDKAIDKIKYAVDLDVLSWDDQAGTLKILAVLSLQQEKYQAAIDNYNEWFKFTEKHDPQVYTHKALSYYQLKNYDKTVEQADMAIKYAEEPKADIYQIKMSAFVDQKKYDKAIEVCIAALEYFPKDKKWWLPLGQFYLIEEDYQRALSTFELADKQGFLEKESHFKILAQLYSIYGIPYKAAKTMEEHMKAGTITKDAKNLAVTANYYHQASEYKDAANTYLAAGKLSNDPEHYKKAGDLLSLSEQYKQAIASYEKAIDMGSEKTAAIKVALIEANFYSGNYKKAYQYAKESLESKQHKRMAQGWLGYIKDTANRKGVDI